MALGLDQIERKSMSVEEFRSHGYLQEMNRLFLNPLGLNLGVTVDSKRGEEFGLIRDMRDDTEGVIFKTFNREKAEIIAEEYEAKGVVRKKLACCNEMGVQDRDVS